MLDVSQPLLLQLLLPRKVTFIIFLLGLFFIFDFLGLHDESLREEVLDVLHILLQRLLSLIFQLD